VYNITAQHGCVDVIISHLLLNGTFDAAEKAIVKRFVPRWFATMMPRGLVSLRDGLVPLATLHAQTNDDTMCIKNLC
jgi:hypothetical protein